MLLWDLCHWDLRHEPEQLGLLEQRLDAYDELDRGVAVDPAVVERLNDSGADVIWVGLGSPKQDIWMMRYRPVLRAPLLIGVGAAFDMLAGVKSQAPRWMQRSGLEWVFRLAQEPRRLGRRYLVYNPLFVWHVLREGI